MASETINIYTSKDQRKLIDKLKVKYQLSLTTIVDILVFVTTKYMESNTEKFEELTNKYVYKKGGKTSIKKPKIFKTLKWNNVKENRFATNVLLIYIKKDIANWLKNKDDVTKYYNLCNEKMTKTEDQFWNYNQHIRMQRRMLRENKEYFKRELENA